MGNLREVEAVQTIAMFTGTLLRVEHAVETGIVQLVFRESGQNQLCISTDAAHAALKQGKRYQVEGAYNTLATGKPYLHEPTIVPIRQQLLAGWQFRLATGVAALALIGAGTFAAPWHHSQAALNVTKTSSNAAAAPTPTTRTVEKAAPGTNPVEASATTPADTAPKTVTSTKKTTTTIATTPILTQPVTQAPFVPDCDTVTTAFDTQNQTDDTQLTSYTEVTQQGIDGVDKVCYPNGRSNPSTTTSIVQKQDKIIVSGTLSDATPL